MARGSSSKKRLATPAEIRSPGEVFAVPLRRGWWGAARLIEVAASQVPPFEMLHTFLVVDGFWRAPPRAQDLRGRGLMKGPFGHKGLHQEEWKGWFSGSWPTEFVIVTSAALTTFEKEQASSESGTMVFQSARDFARRLFDQWRWVHEREAYLQERRETQARASAKARAKKEARAKGLSLASMARERPFEHWGRQWPKSVVAQARRIFQEATRDLIELQGTSKRKQRIAVLRGIVDAFNALDKEHECIETTEREEVVQRIEELASLVGLANKREGLTGHRDW